jgi:hypothetical protein
MNTNKRTMLTRIFIIFVAMQALLELFIGAAMLIDFPLVVETGFQLTHTSNMDLFGLVAGLQLILLAVMMGFGIIWTNKGLTAGPIIEIAAGIYFALFGILSFFKFGDTGGLYADSIRGIITAVMGYMVYLEIKNRD